MKGNERKLSFNETDKFNAGQPHIVFKWYIIERRFLRTYIFRERINFVVIRVSKSAYSYGQGLHNIEEKRVGR